MMCHGDRAPYPQLPSLAEEMMVAGCVNIQAPKGFKRPALNLDGLLRDFQNADFAENDHTRTSEQAHETVGAIETQSGVGLTLSRFNLELLTKRLADYQASVELACYPKNYVGTLADYVRGVKDDNDYLSKELRCKQKAIDALIGERDAAEAKHDELHRKAAETLQAVSSAASPYTQTLHLSGNCGCIPPKSEKWFMVALKGVEDWSLYSAGGTTFLTREGAHRHINNLARAYGVDRVKLLEVVPFQAEVKLNF